MDKKNIEIAVKYIIDTLALACGGRSQYSWQSLGNALKGHMRQGMLQGANLTVVLDAVVELEMEHWECELAMIQQAMIRRQIQDGIEKK